VGGVALAGWIFDRPPLYGLLGVGEGLPPSAALGLLVLGLGVAVVAPDWRRAWMRRIAAVPALITFGIGAAGLVEAAAGIDLVFYPPFAAWQRLAVGRMPFSMAGALVLGSAALAALALGNRREAVYAQILALAILGITGVGLTGHLYGLDALLAVSPLTVVPHAGLAGLLAVALGLVLARPEVGVMTLVVDPTAGGASVRRLLPVTIVIVLLLGAFRVWSESEGYVSGALGTAIFAVATVFLIGGLIVWNALRLREAERSLLREQEIREERQRQFRHAIVEAPIPILMFAEDGEVLQVSRTVEEITGYGPEELPDLAAWGRLVAGEEGGPDAARELLESLDEFHETVVGTRGGEERTWRIRTSSLGVLTDDRSAYVTMATDLTEIREADERKDEFLAILGHELRNPLAALKTGIELQRRHRDPARRAAIVDMMGRQVGHLVRLLDDLLDVSRISRGKIELRREVVSLNEAIERTVEEHRDLLLEERSPRISLRMPPRTLAVSADPTRLHQLLGNLLGNAVKYTPEDGRVWVTLEREGDEAVVRVRDSGVGLEPHEIATIFEPFRQVGRDRHQQRGGLGLGLTLVRQLATLHGGTVDATSRGRGHGSTFTLRLPVAAMEIPAAREPPAAAEGAAEPPEPASCLRVLVVDDQPDVADGFCELLNLSGYEAEAAYGGVEALELDERHHPQVVFLDLDLPDLDGHTVARRIRERHAKPPLLVAVSGFGGARHLERSREAGIDHHLVKPVVIEQVLELLRSAAAAAESL
jgi:PAS domain S-box-containing protein